MGIQRCVQEITSGPSPQFISYLQKAIDSFRSSVDLFESFKASKSGGSNDIDNDEDVPVERMSVSEASHKSSGQCNPRVSDVSREKLVPIRDVAYLPMSTLAANLLEIKGPFAFVSLEPPCSVFDLDGHGFNMVVLIEAVQLCLFYFHLFNGSLSEESIVQPIAMAFFQRVARVFGLEVVDIHRSCRLFMASFDDPKLCREGRSDIGIRFASSQKLIGLIELKSHLKPEGVMLNKAKGQTIAQVLALTLNRKQGVPAY